MADGERPVGTFTFHGWKYRHYFECVSVKDVKNVNVRCKLCVGRKLLSTAAGNTTSTLLKHLEKTHENVKLVAKAAPDDDTEAPTQKLDFGKDASTLNGDELKKLVAGYIVEDMLPLVSVVKSLLLLLLGGRLLCPVPPRQRALLKLTFLHLRQNKRTATNSTSTLSVYTFVSCFVKALGCIVRVKV